MRKAAQYSAASTRVLAAEYNSTKRRKENGHEANRRHACAGREFAPPVKFLARRSEIFSQPENGMQGEGRQYGIRIWSKRPREGAASSAIALKGLAPPSAPLLATFRHEKCRLLSNWLKITDKRKTQETRQKVTFYYHSTQDRAKNVTNKPAKHHDALLNVKTRRRNIPIKANVRPRGRKYAKEKGLRHRPFAPSPQERHCRPDCAAQDVPRPSPIQEQKERIPRQCGMRSFCSKYPLRGISRPTWP